MGSRIVPESEEIPEIVAAIAEFVNAPEPYTIGFDPPISLRDVVREVQLLPVILDAGGCLGLRSDADVSWLSWDDPYMLRAEPDTRIRNMVYHRASATYPALRFLAPRRPDDAIECPDCSGSRRCSGLPATLADRVVCSCGGLGWLPRLCGESEIR